MARPRKSEQRDLRAAAIRAGLEILQISGRDAVTMSAVADLAECRAPALYRYFDGKDGLLEVLQQWGFEWLMSQQKEHIDETQDLAARLSGFARAHISFATRHPALYSLMFNGPTPRLPPLAVYAYSSPSDRCFDMLRQSFLTGNTRWSGTQAETAAFAFWVMMHGAISIALRDPTGDASALQLAEKTINLAVGLFAAPVAELAAA
ncbi:TetR/AcrR family transcriptional regulator [Lacibacterium aquatile]|uniref:TetR/AcrR family transcriptional regulator n=1 Tax=Lacibacterium aquatile TaxID=1168082 RepID=A0ABW5DR43_9PROT